MNQLEGRNGGSFESFTRHKNVQRDELNLYAKQIQEGDISGMDRLYNAMFPGLVASILRRLGNFHDAEDVAAKSLVKIYENIEKFDSSKGSFGPWAMTITNNTLKDFVKSPGFSRRENAIPLETSVIIDSTASVEKLVERRIIGNEVDRLVMQLPKKFSQVLFLRYYKDFSMEEIASYLNIPESTVKTRLRIALNRMRLFSSLQEFR